MVVVVAEVIEAEDELGGAADRDRERARVALGVLQDQVGDRERLLGCSLDRAGAGRRAVGRQTAEQRRAEGVRGRRCRRRSWSASSWASSASSSGAACLRRRQRRCRPCSQPGRAVCCAVLAFLFAAAIGCATASRACVLISGFSRKNQISASATSASSAGRSHFGSSASCRNEPSSAIGASPSGCDRDRERHRLRLPAHERARRAHAQLHERRAARGHDDLGRAQLEAQRLCGIGRGEAHRALGVAAVVDGDLVARAATAARGARQQLGRVRAVRRDGDRAFLDDRARRVLARCDPQAERDAPRARRRVARRAGSAPSPCPRRRGTARCSAAGRRPTRPPGRAPRRPSRRRRCRCCAPSRCRSRRLLDRPRARAVPARRRLPFAEDSQVGGGTTPLGPALSAR